VDHKGHRYLIRAATQIVREMPDVRIVILGEGERRSELTELIKQSNLERHVLLPGFRPDVLSLLKTFELFVMPSVTEGLGTSLLDAMACRRAIVASRVGGIPEVVAHGETGLLVPPKDPDALAGAIQRVLGDSDLAARLARAGRTRVEQRFTTERMVAETVGVYERLL
jgi:glycosyltransferase involved in cell wall biosynthesis